MSSKCCPTDVKPAVNDYKGVGSCVTLDGLYDMYVTGSGTKAIILVYDIFGWTPNAEQVADSLASSGGFLVVIPDFMKGQPWPPSNIPPTKDGAFPEGIEPADGTDVLMNWIMTHPSCKQDRTDEVVKIKEYLVSNHSITQMGMVGMCWGAKVAFNAAKQAGLVQAVASCHGSFLDKADAEAIVVPMCLLNSKEEPEAYDTDIKPVVESKSFKDKNVYKNFPTMHHGWMGTRGVTSVTDFEKEEVRLRWNEALVDLVNFFTAAL